MGERKSLESPGVISTQWYLAISQNHFRYFLKKLPWLVRKSHDTAYQISTIKPILSILVETAKVLYGFLGASPFPLPSLFLDPCFFLDRNLLKTLVSRFTTISFSSISWRPLSWTPLSCKPGETCRHTPWLTCSNSINETYLFPKLVFTLGIKDCPELLIFLLLSLFTNISVPESLMRFGYSHPLLGLNLETSPPEDLSFWNSKPLCMTK